MTDYRVIAASGFERILRCEDPTSGLLALIAVHDTSLGPAVGGCRMWPYASEADALADAKRLARGMTFKAALADLPLGGGKAVIIGDGRRDKSARLFRAFGRAIDSLGGAYVTGEDVGTSVADMEHVRRETRFVAGIADGSGDPSPMTARGVLHGLRAAVRHRFGADSLDGLTVAVQGLGHVGHHLCRLLHAEGAALLVSDIRPAAVARAVEEFAALAVAPDAIVEARADVLAPCALGGIINPDSRSTLRAGVIAGAANNQLASPEDGLALFHGDVLYAPDYVINAGGLISGSQDILRAGQPHDRTAALADVARIGDRLAAIFAASAEQRVPPEQVAADLAQARLDCAAKRPGKVQKTGQDTG